MKPKQGEKHFTASAWIITTSKPKKMLLVHHKKFDKWMQPGGHIEEKENAVEAAVREVREETGLDISFLLKQTKIVDNDASFLPVPKYIMEQKIPTTDKEPEHYHLDMEYVVEVPEQDLLLSEREARGIGWFTKDEIMKMPVHEDTKIVVSELI